jgi:acyl-CoA synthetase (NDP forming)
VTREIFAADADAAVAAAEQIGYPVVMKAVARALIHKSDIGAVKLALANPEAIRGAWHDIAEAVRSRLPEVELAGCVVQEMATDGVEIILGTKWDPQFGAVVMAGTGGIFVEIMNDVALALAPLTRNRARAMLEGLRVWPLLTGARGRAPCDVEALVDALERLSGIAHALGPRLAELDVNPLLVRQQGVVALDARATLAAFAMHGGNAMSDPSAR